MANYEALLRHKPVSSELYVAPETLGWVEKA